MLLEIITEPNKILHQIGVDIELAEIKSVEFQKFVDDMVETMYKKDGVGLAAPQVGVSKKLTVITKEYTNFERQEDLILINPRWEKLSRWQSWDEEGCLSVPNIWGKVKRYKKIKVSGLNRQGKNIEFLAEGFFARIIQHEIDHLHGILFIEKAKDLHEIVSKI